MTESHINNVHENNVEGFYFLILNMSKEFDTSNCQYERVTSFAFFFWLQHDEGKGQ